MVRFKLLTGDVNWQDYGGKFVSQKLNNGEFDYWLVMEVINYEVACGTTDPRYGVTLSTVAPSQVNEKQRRAALESCGMSDEWLAAQEEKLGDLFRVEVFSSYGIQATLWQKEGNNLSRLMKDAREEAQKANLMFGFYMDRAQNAIGSTGWDVLEGNLLAGIGIYE